MADTDRETAVNSRATSLNGQSEKTSPPMQNISQLNGDSKIARLYFTFDTELPNPPKSSSSSSIAGTEPKSLPKCPDLRSYIHPFKWSPARKAVILILTCIATMLTAYTAGAYSPPVNAMANDFHTTRLVTVAGITTFCLGFGFAPMALAPMSEVWGRYPIFICAGFVFVIFQVVCSLVTTITGMLIARFLVGAGASVFSAVVGGVIADLWGKEGRNTPMSIFSGSVLFGTGAGPLVSSAIGQAVSSRTLYWKWAFWHQVILDAVLVLFLIVFFKESRASVLLSRKAKTLNKWYESLEKAGVYGVWVLQSDLEHNMSPMTSNIPLPNTAEHNNPSSSETQRASNTTHQLHRIRWVVKEDELRPSVGTLMRTSVARPFHMLFTEPVVFSFSLWAAFSWAILYLSFAFVPYLYSDDFNKSSRVYIAMMAAAVVATVSGILMETLLQLPQWRSSGPHTDSKFWAMMRRYFPADSPEARLYFACIVTLLLPAGLFIAFLAPQSWQQYAQAIGLGFATWGIYSVYLATFNYLADTYHIYASSALAAQSLCRNILGGIFPIIATPLFGNLGLKGAGGLLGGIAALLTLIPWVLMIFGGKIRARSKFAMSLQK